MAAHLNLEDQEQLDQIKHFWAQYGNIITWVLIAVFGSTAAWNGWNYWQRSQASKASALYEELQRATVGGDAAKVERAFNDMKDGFGSTTYAAQAALLAGKALFDAQKTDAARAALTWAMNDVSDPAYQGLARLRLAGLEFDAKAYDQALKLLDVGLPKALEPLAQDRKADVLLAQGKAEEARALYLQAWKSMPERVEYRQLIEVKLASLGVDVSTQAIAAVAAEGSK
jgi:predicted negative regulator of RcsB-dependent stress response